MLTLVVTLWSVSVASHDSGPPIGTPPAGDPASVVAPRVQNIKWIEPRTPITPATTPGDGDSIFRISTPGSYYLVGNVVGTPGKVGIKIVSSGVSVDLMGFDLSGVPGSLEGIKAWGDRLSNISIANGCIRHWGRSGILMHPSSAYTHLRDLRVTGNGFEDISQAGVSTGTQALVEQCSFHANGGWGLYTNYRSRVRACAASENGLDGFVIGETSAITQCTATANSGSGFVLRYGSTADECNAHGNLTHGIIVEGPGCQVRQCTSGDNQGAGISVTRPGEGSRRNRIDGNHVYQNNIGIFLSPGGSENLVIRNSATGNSTNYLIKDLSRTVGPIVDLTTGDDFLTAPHANHPWANFSH